MRTGRGRATSAVRLKGLRSAAARRAAAYTRLHVSGITHSRTSRRHLIFRVRWIRRACFDLNSRAHKAHLDMLPPQDDDISLLPRASPPPTRGLKPAAHASLCFSDCRESPPPLVACPLGRSPSAASPVAAAAPAGGGGGSRCCVSFALTVPRVCLPNLRCFFTPVIRRQVSRGAGSLPIPSAGLCGAYDSAYLFKPVLK